MVIPKKRLGQNFLVDKKVVADFVAAAELSKADTVVEIGAGTGILTKELAKQAGQVLAFELDRDLVPILKKELNGLNNIEIINEDFLKVKNSVKSILLHSSILFEQSEKCKVLERSERFLQSPQFKLVGSIPYQITSPLIHKLLTLEPKPLLVVLLIQKEVAEKITAKPPQATYLSNIVQFLGEIEIVRLVPKAAFWPVPEVDGAIIKLKMQNAKCKIKDIEGFQKFLHRGFQNPRKMLRNKFEANLLERCNINPNHRAQHLEFRDWLNAFELLG